MRRSSKSHRTGVAIVALTLGLATFVAPSASGTGNGLSISVNRATVRLRSTTEDSAGAKGAFAFTGGAQAECGDDVHVSFADGAALKADGDDFQSHKALCIWRQGTGRLRAVVLNFRSGTWAVTLRSNFDGLVNPVVTRLSIGSATGRQTIEMTETRSGWRYP
jgi:hypothetical protein